MQNCMKYNDYCVVSINHPILAHFPNDIVNKYTKRVHMQFKRFYIDKITQKTSFIFHHNVMNFMEVQMIFTHLCQNYILQYDNVYSYESHIYDDRFVVDKVITSTIKRACDAFKQSLNKRKCIVQMTLNKLEFPYDIKHRIFNAYFGKVCQ
jgi:hypothetical protein